MRGAVGVVVLLLVAMMGAGCSQSAKKSAPRLPSGNYGDTVFTGKNDLTRDLFKRRVYLADTNQIKKLFGKPVQLQVIDKADSLGKYKIYHFANETDTLDLFRNPTEGFYIDHANIADTVFRLRKDVKIGMPKAEFMKLLNANFVKYDTIYVLDEVGFLRSTFVFKDQKLKKIKMQQSLD